MGNSLIFTDNAGVSQDPLARTLVRPSGSPFSLPSILPCLSRRGKWGLENKAVSTVLETSVLDLSCDVYLGYGNIGGMLSSQGVLFFVFVFVFAELIS